MYTRLITPSLLAALADSPVVFLNGARQTGKTTLVRALSRKTYAAAYVTLDDATTRAAAHTDPAGFLSGFHGPLIIDEVQHVPQLFPAIKILVDNDRVPGRFLLTGSANVMLLPRVSESLAGRMEILTLWPLAQAEIEGRASRFCDVLFRREIPIGKILPVDRVDLVHRLLAGGYPEPLSRSSHARRRAWFRSYLTTILQRDVRDIASINGLSALPHLFTLLAARSGAILNMADIARSAALPYATLYRYMAVLQTTFLVQLIPAWSGNLTTRLVKAPKVLLNDTGLIAHLLGVDAERLTRDGALWGMLLENFVAMEIKKDAGWSETQPQLYYFRTHSGQEVDLLLEEASGRLVGVEVKASSNLSSADFNGLRALSRAVGERFVQGVVLYTGDSVLPFGENLAAIPVSALWHL